MIQSCRSLNSGMLEMMNLLWLLNQLYILLIFKPRRPQTAIIVFLRIRLQ